MSDYTEECIKVGREYKQLIQLFSDQTIFGFALLEQANNLTIDESDAEMSKCACDLLHVDAYQIMEELSMLTTFPQCNFSLEYPEILS